jgi:hypothetical protein
MRQRSVVQSCVLCVIVLSAASARAQVVQEYVTGLLSPIRLVAQPDGSLFVAEGGTGRNDGRVSLVDRDGRRFTVIDGLPSGLFMGTDPSGPSGVLLRGQRLFILIGGGNSVLVGPAPGSELPNPNPTSPLFNSVLLVDLASDQTVPLGFTFPPEAHSILVGGGAVYIGNGRGEQIRVSRLVDFPDFVAEPRPDVPANVRGANTFGIVGSDAHLDIVDAARNLAFAVDIASPGSARTLVTFAPVANPLAPMGPPVVDAVPSSIRGSGDALIVSYLTGFPFAAGAASVQVVDRHAGTTRTLISGLQTVIDTAPSATPEGQIYVLEYSRNFLANAPGRLLRFDSPTARPIVIADPLANPTSVVVDPRTGDLWVSEIRAGRIVRVLAPR